MAIVNREWVGFGTERRLVVSAVRGDVASYEINLADGIARLGGEQAAIEYGIKAAVSDAGNTGDARAKIASAKKWLEGSPDPRAVVAEYEKKMAEMANELAELRKLREG